MTDNIDFLLPKKNTSLKTLVLDLDETLVHSQFQPFDNPSDIILKIELEDEIHDIHVMVRPGVDEFLKTMGKIFEIVIFTASVAKYADPLLDIIDKNKIFKFRLFREHCTQVNNSYIKELTKLGRELKDVIIVDNSPVSYSMNPENGLPILTWLDDKDDRELYNISSVLQFLSFVPDVRNYIPEFVINDEISYNNVISVFDKYDAILTEKNQNNLKNKNKNNSKSKTYNDKIIYDQKENNKNSMVSKNNKVNNNNQVKCESGINKEKKINNHKRTKTSKLDENKLRLTNDENINPNIINVENINNDVQKSNQTTKNKNNKNLNFNPYSILSNIQNPNTIKINYTSSNFLIPKSSKKKNMILSLNEKLTKTKSNISKNRKIEKFNYVQNNNENNSKCLVLNNYVSSKHTSSKNKIRLENNFKLSSKKEKNSDISHVIDKNCNYQKNIKKISKSLGKEKISISFSSTKENLNKSNNANSQNHNNYGNNFSGINASKNKKDIFINFIYHKKHKSSNYMSPIYSKTNCNSHINKNSLNSNRLKYLSNFSTDSDNYGTNCLNRFYSSKTSQENHSIIINPENNNFILHGNIYLDTSSYNPKNSHKNKKSPINGLKTDRGKDNNSLNNFNYNIHINKNKIPNNNKNRNSAFEGTFKKKIPFNKKAENKLNNDKTKIGFHKKNISLCNLDSLNGFMAVLPKTAKRFFNSKNCSGSKNKKLNKIGINNLNINNVSIKKKDKSLTYSSTQTN